MQDGSTLPAIRHWYAHETEAGDLPRPRTWNQLFTRLYSGDLFVLAGTEASRSLAARVRQCLADVAGFALPEDAGASAAWRCPALAVDTVGKVREVLYAQPDLHAQAARVVAGLGMRAAARVDSPRLRVITAGAERAPAAAPVYVVHRDTWYGCAEAQVNWWIPIFDTPAEQAFVFYPDYFHRAVPNTSARFDYARWMETIGWHGEAPIEAYPQPSIDVTGAPTLRFDCNAGDILLFAAAQLHQTRPNPVAGSSRLSIDLRTVIDMPGLAAPNVDNASTGASERVAREFVPVSALI